MDNLFQKILNTVSSVFKGAQKNESTAVGIDIGTASIKMVQLTKKNGKAVLETYGELPLGPYADLSAGEITNLSNDKIVEALKNAMEGSGITTKNSAFSVSSANSLIFVIELPGNITNEQLNLIVPTESRKYIPVPISEVSLDWWMIPKPETDSLSEEELKNLKTEVLVAAILKESIYKFQEIVKKSDLQSDFFEIEIFSSIRSTFSHELSPVLLMDFGASKTKLAIIERGVVKRFHVVNRGSADLSRKISQALNISFEKAENLKKENGLLSEDVNVSEVVRLGVDYIITETNSVVLNYEKRYNKVIGKIILVGGGSLLKGFLEMAQDNFRSEVVLGQPFSKTETPVFLEGVLNEVGSNFSVAVGLALKKIQ